MLRLLTLITPVGKSSNSEHLSPVSSIIHPNNSSTLTSKYRAIRNASSRDGILLCFSTSSA
jgi:hypothetical protein